MRSNKLFLVLVALVSALLSLYAGFPTRYALAQNPTPTYVFPPPTRDPIVSSNNKLKLVREDLAYTQVRLDCLPLCWLTFVPGQTIMRSVLEALRQIAATTPRSNGTYDIIATDKYRYVTGFQPLPNDSVQFGIGLIFSDDTQPETLMRAYQIELGMKGIIPQMLDNDLSALLPKQIIQRAGLPRKIAVDPTMGNSYSLTLEYEKWAIQYIGIVTRFIDGNRICPTSNTPGIVIYGYSDRESDSVALAQSLRKYEGAGAGIRLVGNGKEFRYSTNPQRIQQIATELATTDCIAIPQFASLAKQPAFAPSPMPVITSTPMAAATSMLTATNTPSPAP